jgi:hypothetical protein
MRRVDPEAERGPLYRAWARLASRIVPTLQLEPLG